MRQQLPARGDESIGIDPSRLIDGLQSTACRIAEHEWPGNVAVAFDDSVGSPETERLVRIERGVNAAKGHGGPASPRQLAKLVSAKGVAGVNADPDDIAGLNGVHIDGLEGVVRDPWVSKRRRRRGSEDEQPPRRYHADAEGEVARIHEMNGHGGANLSLSTRAVASLFKMEQDRRSVVAVVAQGRVRSRTWS